MSEAKHTPGPWDVDEGDFSIYHMETGNPIAEMLGNQTVEEAKANARLMASAPNMADEITLLRAENETLRRDVKTAVMGDSAELQDVKRENEKLRAALKVVCQGVISERGDIDCAVIESAALRAAAAAIRESGE